MHSFSKSFAVFLSCITLLPGSVRAESAPTKVGVMLALSGDLAGLGGEVSRGIELAADEIGRDTILSPIVVEDIGSLDPKRAVTAAQKLTNVDKVNAALTMIVEEAQPTAPIFNAQKVPLLVLWDSNFSLKKSGEYIFSNGFSTESAGELLAKYAARDLKLQRIAVVGHVNPWSEIITRSFIGRLKHEGAAVVHEAALAPETTDYKSAIGKLRTAKPDGIFLPLVPPNSSVFLKQLRELGVKLPLLAGDALIQESIDAAGEAAEGVYVANIYTDNADTIAAKYKTRFGSEPVDATLVSLGYDGLKKIAAGTKTAAAMGTTLQAALLKTFGPARSADRIEKLYQVKAGKLVAVQ